MTLRRADATIRMIRARTGATILALSLLGFASCELVLPSESALVNGSGGSAGAGGSGGGGNGGGGGQSPCCPGSVDGGCTGYTIHHATSTPALDASCDNQAWAAGQAITFTGPKNGVFPETTYSCRLIWDEADSKDIRVFGCCNVRDENLAVGVTKDGGTAAALPGDDGFEYIFSHERAFGPDTFETIVNIQGVAQTLAFEGGVGAIDDSGEFDAGFETDGSLNDGASNDVGYTISFAGDIPLAVLHDHRAYCQFALHNRDAPDAAGAKSLTGSQLACGDNVNDTASWTICEFE